MSAPMRATFFGNRASAASWAEAPQTQCNVDLERARCGAPIPDQRFDRRETLPDRVDVDAQNLGSGFGVLVAVEVTEQRGRKRGAALLIMHDQRTDRCIGEVREARLIVRFEQRRVERKLVLA